MVRSRWILFGLLILTVAQLACALPGGSAEPTPTLYVFEMPTADGPAEATVPAGDTGGELPPAPDATSAPVEEPARQYPYLDPCTLVTADEAAAALGAPVHGDEFGLDKAFGSCSWRTDGFAGSVTVTASYGAEAKGLVMLGVGMLAGISDDPAVDEFNSSLLSRFNTMSLADLLIEVSTRLPELDDEDTPPPTRVEGIGDVAFWNWDAEESEGELIVVSGEKYVSVRLAGKPQAEARPLVEGLVRTALERLPEEFSTLNPPPTPTP